MQEIVTSPLAPWQNFYVIIGTAAATLTGLIFIVVTLLTGVRQRVSAASDSFGVFNSPNIVHFCAVLLVAATLSAPWPALWMAGLLLGLLGLGGVLYMGIVLRRARRQIHYQPVLEDWLWHTIFPSVSYAALLIAAIWLSRQPTLTSFVIAAGTVALLFIGIHNAWDDVAYIALELYPHGTTSHD